jgi:hypothetical protein
MHPRSTADAKGAAAIAPTQYRFPVKTPIAARVLRVTYYRLIALINRNTLDPPPEKDTSGDYLWTEADIERARFELSIDRRRKSYRDALKNATETGEGKVPV